VVTVSSVLEARDLYRFFHAGDDETLALRVGSLGVDAGELLAVTGPSGSGKSTLLACLAGLDEPDGGSVRLAGHVMSRRPEPERAALRARFVGVLYQTSNLLDELTVFENVTVAQRIAGEPQSEAARSLLRELRLEHSAGRRPRTLSGGESVRAGLAVALANNPSVILADEPTGELDSQTARHVIDLLRRRCDRGAGGVLVTHDPQVAALADREIHLHDGRIDP